MRVESNDPTRRTITRGRLWLVCGLAILVGGGCGDGDATRDDAGRHDAGPGSDALVGDATAADQRVCGPLPDPAPTWLVPYQGEIVGRLTGEREVTPGQRLADRFSIAHRQLARDYLRDALTQLGLVPELDAYATGANVYAQLDASSPSDEFLVVGAHYDSVEGCPGANDNASGVAAVLAAARHLAQLACRSKNVLFVFFDEEEEGQVGSKHFAKLLFDAQKKIVGVHTIDQMGWDDDGDRAIELERPDAGLYQLYAAALSSGGFAIPLVQTKTGGTDHVAFRPYGFPAVGLTEEYVSGDTTPHYHQPSDLYATVNLDYLASSSALWNHVLATLLRP